MTARFKAVGSSWTIAAVNNQHKIVSTDARAVDVVGGIQNSLLSVPSASLMTEQCMRGVDDSSSSRIAKASSPCRKTGQHDVSGDGPPKENPIIQEGETPLPHKGEVAHQANPASSIGMEPMDATGLVADFKKNTMPKGDNHLLTKLGAIVPHHSYADRLQYRKKVLNAIRI